MFFDGVQLGQNFFIVLCIGPTVVDHVDTSGETKTIKEIRGNVQVKNCVFIHKFREMLWCWTFSSNNGSFFWDILESVHWEMIYLSDMPTLGSLQCKEIRYEK